MLSYYIFVSLSCAQTILKRATWSEIYPDLKSWKQQTVKVEKLGIASTVKSATKKS